MDFLFTHLINIIDDNVELEDLDVGFEDVHSGPIAPEADGGDVHVQNDEVVVTQDEEVIQVPKPHPAPRPPSKRDRDRHDLIHAPYAPWCKHSVFGRRNNCAHQEVDSEGRVIPALHLDYCFLRDSRDDDCLTGLVGRLTPSQTVFACPCDVKGPDPYVVHRLKAVSYTHLTLPTSDLV